MATLPRPTKTIPVSSSASSPQDTNVSLRIESQFDAGINSSTAWTEHLERGSLSDDDPDDDPDISNQKGCPARALYHFEGKVEFRELNVDAGDELDVLKEEVGDGWSLVRNEGGEIGLLPRSYYTFTSDFSAAPTLDIPSFHRKKEASSSSLTPRGSPKGESQSLPIVPQNTGEWRNALPSFRQSLLGGKSLNRFSTFVTSGAEEWVLNGSAAEAEALEAEGSHQRLPSQSSIADDDDNNRLSSLATGEADRHFVDAGPAWQTKVPPFRVLVHSPSKRTSVLSGAYTIYNVTSLFYPSIPEEEDLAEYGYAPPASPTRITVHRRFSHFVVLHTALTKRLPGIALPPLPEKQYAGRFSTDFVEARRGDLERYIGRIVRHPIARYAEVMTSFLGCESDSEWKRLVPQHLALPAAGPSFFARVFHPAFNVDAEDAAETVNRFDGHLRSVGKGVQGLRNIFGRVREARLEMSKAERLLSYSLLSLITSKPLASAPMNGISEEEEGDESDAKVRGPLNSQGAWCWREDCKDCLSLMKAMDKTSETLQSVADLYDDHARRTQLATHESLKSVAHPFAMYEGVIETHRSTLSRYHGAIKEDCANEDVAGRCETVLNTTMAEMETYHAQKLEDFNTVTREHLDGEIAFYEQVLVRLRSARRTFDSPQYDILSKSPRQASRYERELENPNLAPSPLSQPCPHVYDSAPMRPVSVAIQEGVGMILGGTSGRASVFGKFW
ncbi:hypothetical protein SERLA73DRAFT_102119 [Serpula lacrymans var. lacrymans S7.3]|uniref:PX domain-containing protein n=2 Tax=Serpula lacrymans var. lacrymans TaxID=341189 RepID=F8PKA9_SERL3|nr:uncharacterized protein SERLADRAFT_359630 [Serpula lacrymans var. lacrymans S7.9]EGO03823.1 hypothetical protein SERLA73DRAFT_102119 [Serpula lacrymans var. lacrymans S7.3]EGO29750.1 hypothetical protein SERLADRAFT_359630 [Serpula lacrymans var. lacrymans S7.9]